MLPPSSWGADFFLVLLDTLDNNLVKESLCPSPLLGILANFWQYLPGLYPVNFSSLLVLLFATNFTETSFRLKKFSRGSKKFFARSGAGLEVLGTNGPKNNFQYFQQTLSHHRYVFFAYYYYIII